SQIGSHRVDRIGQVLPGAGHAGNHSLHSQTPFGADLARDASHFGSKRAELLDHRVDGFFELEDFAAHIHGNLAREIAFGYGDGHVDDIADLRGEIAGHEVDVVGEVLPGSRHAGHLSLPAQFAFGADLARHARNLGCEAVELVHHRVDGFLELQNL